AQLFDDRGQKLASIIGREGAIQQVGRHGPPA
ncbi:MAG: hypothetical protein RL328_1348, partial [Acidobacteriota bacterium]